MVRVWWLVEEGAIEDLRNYAQAMHLRANMVQGRSFPWRMTDEKNLFLERLRRWLLMTSRRM